MAAASEDPLVGTLFADRYHVERQLGAGGMGAVYQVRDLALGERVALKLLLRELASTPAAVLRFREEVRLSRKVTHENVARVHDVSEHAGTLYLTMELVDGETLRERLSRLGRLALPEALRIGVSLSKGLGAAHSVGIVHRDIKPPNVLLATSGRVVLSDFGIARSVADHSDLTKGAVGTRRYMPPEQALGRSVDARADIYAVGLVLMEMLTGELLAPHEAEAACLAAGAGAELATLVAKCLEADPARRPQSCGELLSVLEVAAGHVTSASTQEATAAFPDSFEPVAPSRELSRGRSGHHIGLPMRSLTPSLAVLPIRYRGPEEHAYIADAIADELIDVLSTSRELRVLGSGATARFREERDATSVGGALAVESVIDGTLQMTAERGRLTTRLLDVRTGAQIWTGSHEGPIGDLWEFQQRTAKMVAEKLRFELVVRADQPSDAAVQAYLYARRRLRGYATMGEVLPTLDAALREAPSFGPALAAHALASARSWFDVRERGIGEEACRESVERALASADELSDTHHAAALYAVNRGDYQAAVRSLDRAVGIAPTNPGAHELLGVLEIESNRLDRGVARLRMALDLEPDLLVARLGIARSHALRGRLSEYRAIVDEAPDDQSRRLAPFAATRARIAVWYGDEAEVRVALADLPRLPLGSNLIAFTAAVLRGEVDTGTIEDASLRATSGCPRARALEYQMSCEALLYVGAPGLALVQLERAAAEAFLDLAWLELCPLLGPLRGHPRFELVTAHVRECVDHMWRW